MPLTEEISGRT